MAKEHTDRASRAGVEEAAAASNQHNAAELLKKMKVLADADDAHAAHASTSDEAPAAEQAATDAPAAQTASADGIFASDAAPADVVADASAVSSYASAPSGGISTGTLLAIGGVALVGGGIAIAANKDGGGHHHNGDTAVTAVTAESASVDEGQSINFTVTGTPGATFTWSVDSAHAGDVSGPSSGSVTLDDNGTAVITLNTVADSTTEGSETLTVTVGGVAGSVSINDTSVQPVAANEDLTILTDGAPTFDFSGTTGANIVSAVAAGGNPFTETFSVGDHVIGNGETVLSLKVADGGNEAVVSLEHMGAINLVNAAGFTGATFNAVLWQDIGSINLVDGADGLQAGFTNLHTGVDMTVAGGVAGSLGASLTNDVQVNLGAGHVSDIGWVDNNVDAHIANNEGGGFGMGYSAPAALDLTLGNVNATVGKSANFGVIVNDNGGDGAVTVGNVTVGAGLNSDVDVHLGGIGATTGAHTLTVGNVDLTSAGGPSSTAAVSVGLIEATPGDVTIGDVSANGFHNVTMNLGLIATSSAAPASDVTVGNVAVSITKSGALTHVGGVSTPSIGNIGQNVGDLTVGNIDLSLAQNAAGGQFVVANVISSTGTASASAGNVSAGNVTVTVDTGATSVVGVANQALGAGTGGATLGNVSVGDVALSAAVNGQVGFVAGAIAQSASIGSVGDISVGDVSLSLNDGAVGQVVAGAIAGSHTGDVGNVTVGDVTVDAANGVGASAAVLVEALAAGTMAGGDVGTVTVGNVTAAIGETGTFQGGIGAQGNNVAGLTIGNVDVSLLANGTASLSMGAVALTGNVGDVTIGTISAAAATSATFSGGLQIGATNGNGTIGDVSIGGISLNASATSAAASLSVSASAATDIGNITLGNVVAAAATSASAGATINFVAGANIGNIAVGDVSVTASGTSATAGVGMHYSAFSDVGDVTLGDLSLVATGSGAVANYALAVTGFEVGDVTLGDVSVAVGVTSGAAGSATANLNIVTAGNLGGSIVAGDIDITLAAATTAAGSANFNFSVSSAHGDITLGDIALNVNTGTAGAFNNIGGSVSAAVGDISTGVISVSGGDGSQDALNNFANVLSVFHATTGDIHVDGVDYSGYGAGVTLDAGVAVDDADGVASGFGTIIGSGFADVITDNNGTNVITGGAGADEFHFVATNHGLTADTADQITDWSHAADKIVLDGFGAVNTGNYTELSGSYTDVASFLAAANASSAAGAHGAANDVTVGLVNGTVYIAVDQGGLNDNAEYVIALTGTSNLNDIDVNNFTP